MSLGNCCKLHSGQLPFHRPRSWRQPAQLGLPLAQEQGHHAQCQWRQKQTHQQAVSSLKGCRSSECCRLGQSRPSIRAHAASAAGAGSLEGDDSRSTAQSLSAFVGAFWKFLRPHTIRGTILGSTAVTARALLENPQCIDWALLPRALMGVLALICGNGFIVGLNQIYDVSIDQVNKPFLPIAAGELSQPVAWVLVMGLAAAGISLVAANFGRLITYLYTFGLTLGAVYSAPPFHLKRFPVAAFLIIATVRGFLLNFGVYHAVRAALGLPFVWAPATCFITVFVTVFAIVIAITKDLADVEGDRKYNINTFATKIGVRGIAFLGSGLLLANYVGAAILAVRMPHAFNQRVMLTAHGLMAAFLLTNVSKLEAAKYSQSAIVAFYQAIWNLFYAEYALFPFL